GDHDRLGEALLNGDVVQDLALILEGHRERLPGLDGNGGRAKTEIVGPGNGDLRPGECRASGRRRGGRTGRRNKKHDRGGKQEKVVAHVRSTPCNWRMFPQASAGRGARLLIHPPPTTGWCGNSNPARRLQVYGREMRMNPLTRRAAFLLVGLILTVTSARPVAAATCRPYGVGFGTNVLLYAVGGV